MLDAVRPQCLGGRSSISPPELTGLALDGRYKVERILGRGAFGAVYAGAHVKLGGPVAIKVLQPNYAGGDDFSRRFRREAATLAHLRHPHIVEVIDFGEQHGLEYLVLEYLDGRDLSQSLAGGPLKWERAVSIARGIALALAGAHRIGVVHRDLKPGNIMLIDLPGRPDHVKVLDFGIAKIVDARHGMAAVDAIAAIGVWALGGAHVKRWLAPSSRRTPPVLVATGADAAPAPPSARAAAPARGPIAAQGPQAGPAPVAATRDLAAATPGSVGAPADPLPGLEVVSDPSGAEVLFDGRPLGRTPLTVSPGVDAARLMERSRYALNLAGYSLVDLELRTEPLADGPVVVGTAFLEPMSGPARPPADDDGPGEPSDEAAPADDDGVARPVAAPAPPRVAPRPAAKPRQRRVPKPFLRR